jgi:hypothetical protein
VRDCAARVDFGLKLTQSIERVYRLRADVQAATVGSERHKALVVLLEQARADRRRAGRALSDHLKEHGCASEIIFPRIE